MNKQRSTNQLYCHKKMDNKIEILDPKDEDQIQPPINEEINVELQEEDFERMLDSANNWLKRSTQLMRPTQMYDPSPHEILLTDQGSLLLLKMLGYVSILTSGSLL